VETKVSASHRGWRQKAAVGGRFEWSFPCNHGGTRGEVRFDLLPLFRKKLTYLANAAALPSLAFVVEMRPFRSGMSLAVGPRTARGGLIGGVDETRTFFTSLAG